MASLRDWMVKGMKRYFLLATLLASCVSTVTPADAYPGQATAEFTFYDSGVVQIHTPAQANYVDGNYADIANYANGTAEASRPVSFTLTWGFSISTGEEPTSYHLHVTMDESLTSFTTYACLANSYTFKNLFIGTTYYYFVTANLAESSYSSPVNSFSTESKGPRNVYVSGVTNARDLGGYTTEQGKKVKQGMIYRMGQLNNSYSLTADSRITLEGKKTLLDDFKVRSEIDLREIKNNENGALYGSALGSGVRFYPYHMSWDVTNAAKNEIVMLRRIFKVFADPSNYPVIFHCAIGTDRTGVVAFYLNALIGLNIEDIYRDYLYSNFGNIGGSRSIDNAYSHYAYLSSFEGDSLQEKAYSYFLSIGMTVEELNSILDTMLE